MRILEVATAAVTFVVAVVVALAIPISQLRTVEVVAECCCCPDPAHCHCPTPKDPSKAPQLRNCHRVAHDIVAPQLPSFSRPIVAFVQPSARIVDLPVTTPAAPHPAPASRRPDAPS